MEMTIKRLESHQRLMQEITILRYELNEMNTTDEGLGNSVIKDYSKGFERPQAVVGGSGFQMGGDTVGNDNKTSGKLPEAYAGDHDPTV